MHQICGVEFTKEHLDAWISRHFIHLALSHKIPFIIITLTKLTLASSNLELRVRSWGLDSSDSQSWCSGIVLPWQSLNALTQFTSQHLWFRLLFYPFLYSTLLWQWCWWCYYLLNVYQIPHTSVCIHTHNTQYRMWLNTKIWFLSVIWKTCSKFLNCGSICPSILKANLCLQTLAFIISVSIWKHLLSLAIWCGK